VYGDGKILPPPPRGHSRSDSPPFGLSPREPLPKEALKALEPGGHFLLELTLQSAADNRVRVRFNG
jgi:hypothetical protein